MKKILAFVLILVTVLCCLSCHKNVTGQQNEKLRVVVTAFPHYDFVRQIAGDNVELTMLIKPGNEIHSYDPSPSDMAKISTCDVFVYTGGESDGWVKSILEAAENKDMKTLAFSDVCQMTLDNGKSHEHEENEDGHGESVYDEHVWTSPVNAIKLSEKIKNVLCEADEKNCGVYEENYTEFKAQLMQVDSLFRDAVATGKRGKIVVGDRFPFAHLANEYEIEYLSAFHGCSSETEPSAVAVAKLSKTVKEENIPVVFAIEFSNKRVAKNIADGTGAKILTLHSCHNVTNDEFVSEITYVELMTQNAENIREALN